MKTSIKDKKIAEYASAIKIIEMQDKITSYVRMAVSSDNTLGQNEINKINDIITDLNDNLKKLQAESEKFKILFIKQYPQYIKYINNPSQKLIELANISDTFK